MTMFDLRRTTWTDEDAKILAGVISDDLRRNLLGWDAQDKEVILAYLRALHGSAIQSRPRRNW